MLSYVTTLAFVVIGLTFLLLGLSRIPPHPIEAYRVARHRAAVVNMERLERAEALLLTAVEYEDGRLEPWNMRTAVPHRAVAIHVPFKLQGVEDLKPRDGIDPYLRVAFDGAAFQPLAATATSKRDGWYTVRMSVAAGPTDWHEAMIFASGRGVHNAYTTIVRD